VQKEKTLQDVEPTPTSKSKGEGPQCGSTEKTVVREKRREQEAGVSPTKKDNVPTKAPGGLEILRKGGAQPSRIGSRRKQRSEWPSSKIARKSKSPAAS